MSSGNYIQMFSVHGLLRHENMELGRDLDTGGQINYVVEFAENLSQQKTIKRVDLFTRLIADRSVSDDYSRQIEIINEKCRIIRIQCGGRKYIKKEKLWPHLDEYVDKTIRFIKSENAIPDIVHGHYADSGYVAMQLSKIFGIPCVFTGHSLGRAKKQKLLNAGMHEADINKKLMMEHRIHVEEDILKTADLVITSTNQEIEEQYGLYRDNGSSTFAIIPPGIDIEKFYPFYHDMLPENEKSELAMYAQASMLKELNRFFLHPDKPLILALARPDKRKNITGLVSAYGQDKELQMMANLAIFAGIRKDISQMEENERDVLTRMLLLMDKYDLYGKMAIPKKHDFEYEVPELYRIAAAKKGVFINPALTEPFGITLLEASATGLPMVATNDGGPKDILKNCKNGILIDPTKPKEITSAIKQILSDDNKWETLSKNGIMNVRKHYTWQSHAKTYAAAIVKLVKQQESTDMSSVKPRDAIGKRLARLNYFLVTDIDDTLIGGKNDRLEEFINLLQKNREHFGIGVATGRTLTSAADYLEKHGIPAPDIIISSVGSEIYYGSRLQYSQGWATHISNKWNREKILETLKEFRFLKYQEKEKQRTFKVSYYLKPGKDRIAKIHEQLINAKCKYNLICSQNRYLDILPYRASKGKAIRYISYKWDIPLSNFIVCGDSGNDEEMLRGEPLGVIVGNYSPELETLKNGKNIYFARNKYAAGIMEGLDYYKFLRKIKKENSNR